MARTMNLPFWRISCDLLRERAEARGMMTRNRTAIDLFSAFGVEFVVVLLLTLAIGLAITNYLWACREDLRRSDARHDAFRRRAA